MAMLQAVCFQRAKIMQLLLSLAFLYASIIFLLLETVLFSPYLKVTVALFQLLLHQVGSQGDTQVSGFVVSCA